MRSCSMNITGRWATTPPRIHLCHSPGLPPPYMLAVRLQDSFFYGRREADTYDHVVRLCPHPLLRQSRNICNDKVAQSLPISSNAYYP